jgi:glycosyltransferase involved in cell wall biosynthesis
MKGLITTIKQHRDIKLIRESQLFDERFYITHYPDVLTSGLSPLDHYVQTGSNAGYRPNAYFDDNYYRDTNPDIKSAGTNPLVHFIKYGAKEGRNPSRVFNTSYYLDNHPDVAETNVNPLWHFLTYGAAEHRETDDARAEALSASNRILYEELAQIEPHLPPFDDLEYVPMDRGPGDSLAARAYFKLANKINAPFSHLLVLQRLVLGGAATLSMHYARLVKEKRGASSIVIILADMPDCSASHLLPEGVTMIALDHLQPGLTEEDKVAVLSRFIVEAQPDVVHNMDSNVCWKTFLQFHKQCRKMSKLIASLFMFTYNQAGRKAGYASEYLNSCIDHLDLVLTDNSGFKNEAIEFYAFEKSNIEKFGIAYTPILSPFHEPDPDGCQSKRILWSSRLHPDKRPDLLLAIAQLLPEYTFEIYGDSALSDSEMAKIKKVKNIQLHGPYRNSQDLPRKGIGAYLHTARHEGGAITLKEAVVAGLPAIAPPMGLIPDIITPETGWLVQDMDNPEAYAQAIRECLSDPDERMRRIRNAQELMRREHSWESFCRMVSDLPAYKI